VSDGPASVVPAATTTTCRVDGIDADDAEAGAGGSFEHPRHCDWRRRRHDRRRSDELHDRQCRHLPARGEFDHLRSKPDVEIAADVEDDIGLTQVLPPVSTPAPLTATSPPPLTRPPAIRAAHSAKHRVD
jgi:hypothetical protein